jgi:ribosomal protein S18 acetylase RimI-like enzyme
MELLKCTLEDLDHIFDLYTYARTKQIERGMVVWPEFDRQLIIDEINHGRQYKVVIDGRIAAVWVYTWSDPDIWEEKDKDDSIFIHRICTHGDFRGYRFVDLMVAWCKIFAPIHKRRYIRLDTLGHNTGLIKLYTSAGFDFLGVVHLANTASLPLHYQKEKDCLLFEIDMEK